jgi:hypothetical protein
MKSIIQLPLKLLGKKILIRKELIEKDEEELMNGLMIN